MFIYLKDSRQYLWLTGVFFFIILIIEESLFTAKKSFLKQGECVKSLIDFCDRIIESSNYADDDTRKTTYENVRIYAYSTYMITNLQYKWREQNIDLNIKAIISEILGIQNIRSNSKEDLNYSLHRTAKLSLITLGQFQIENCITLINKALGIDFEKGFFKKVEKLLKHLKFEEDILFDLNVGALIRNSLHQNGFHYGHKELDTHRNLKGVDYDFFHNKRVRCASLAHIAHSLECSLEILNEIIRSEKVKSIEQIKDKYAEKILLERRNSQY